jgi:hypothetical protein
MTKDRIDFENFGGPSYLILVLLSVKCKNLQIDSNQSREITEPNMAWLPADYMKISSSLDFE